MAVKKKTRCEELLDYIEYKYDLNQSKVAVEIKIGENTLSNSRKKDSRLVKYALTAFIYKKEFGELDI